MQWRTIPHVFMKSLCSRKKLIRYGKFKKQNIVYVHVNFPGLPRKWYVPPRVYHIQRSWNIGLCFRCYFCWEYFLKWQVQNDKNLHTTILHWCKIMLWFPTCHRIVLHSENSHVSNDVKFECSYNFVKCGNDLVFGSFFSFHFVFVFFFFFLSLNKHMRNLRGHNWVLSPIGYIGKKNIVRIGLR